ncbi:MAG: nucleotidyl transferase AbiEii/AbiGii toxin family protein [Bdellovibrionales bacterium]|nr:nucleotidyl transferase AbiEii/AbiGii toxin family protein [Bdellovibrionales bacterium]
MSRKEYIKQVKLLLEIMPFVARQECFALKGGTAINLFLQDLPRLSVDIDLTYLPLEARYEALRAIAKALSEISGSLEDELPGRLQVNREHVGRMLSKLIIFRDGAQVKIEPNLVLRGAVYPSIIRPIARSVSTTFEAQLEAKLMSIGDIFGGKVCAALDRQHPRDLFDIRQMFEKWGLTEEIRKAFIVYAASHSRPIAELFKPNFKEISQVYENDFAGMTEENVSVHELEEVRTRLVCEINNVLSSDEREFLLSLKRGEPAWEKLGLVGVEKLPGLRWKLQNIRMMDKKKHERSIEKLKRILRL